MGAPPQLSAGALEAALADENFAACPITVQVLGECCVCALCAVWRRCAPNTLLPRARHRRSKKAAHTLHQTTQPPPTTSTDLQQIQPKEGAPTRVKLTVSDGVTKCTALLASQLRELVDRGALAVGAVIDVHELVGNKKLQATASASASAAKKCALCFVCCCFCRLFFIA